MSMTQEHSNQEKTLTVDIYKSLQTKGRYIVVPADSDVDNLPETVDMFSKKTTKFKQGEKRVGISVGHTWQV